MKGRLKSVADYKCRVQERLDLFRDDKQKR